MKRLLLLTVLVVALVALLVTPALARPTAQAVRPPTDGPILHFMWGGWYFLNSGATDNPWNDVTVGDANDPADTDYFQPLPLTGPVYLYAGWGGAIYGQINNLPKYLDTAVDITYVPGLGDTYSYTKHFKPSDVAPYWTGAHQYDLWWAQWASNDDPPTPLWPPDPFNPKIKAGYYLNHLFLPIVFPHAGQYHIHFVMVQTHPFTDLIPLDPTVSRPWSAKPGPDSPANYVFDLDVYAG